MTDTATGVTPLADTFRARLETIPGTAEPILTVGGVVECSGLDWKVSLEPATPQGANPAILILDLVAALPNGAETTPDIKLPVRYTEAPAKEKYTQVEVRQGSASFTVDVTTDA